MSQIVVKLLSADQWQRVKSLRLASLGDSPHAIGGDLETDKETAYQMQRSYILDDSAARKAFGMQPTSWKQILNDVVAETRGSMKK